MWLFLSSIDNKAPPSYSPFSGMIVLRNALEK